METQTQRFECLRGKIYLTMSEGAGYINATKGKSGECEHILWDCFSRLFRKMLTIIDDANNSAEWKSEARKKLMREIGKYECEGKMPKQPMCLDWVAGKVEERV